MGRFAKQDKHQVSRHYMHKHIQCKLLMAPLNAVNPSPRQVVRPCVPQPGCVVLSSVSQQCT